MSIKPPWGLRQKFYPSSINDIANGQKSVTINMENTESSAEKKEVKLLYFDISYLPRTTQFLLLSTAAFFFFIIYGYMQELIFRLKEFRPFGWYLTLVQFSCYTVFGLLEQRLTKAKERELPLQMYGVLALLTVATMGLSNTSVGYLNYPTQVIFKCCKLIPVMIGGVLIQGKKYTILDISAVLCMCAGLIWFTLADSSVSPNFNTYGVILISLALCADGFIGNVQEKMYKQYNCSNSEMVLYSYSIGFFVILVGLSMTGNLIPAYIFCSNHPMKTYAYAVIFSVTGYIGVNIVLTLVKSFGALVAVTVTTCRKAVSIVVSFLFFAKPFTFMYVWSGLVVVIGIYLNIYSKNKASWDSKFASVYSKFCSKKSTRDFTTSTITV